MHKEKYNYSKCVYTHPHQKIIIICPVHGKFLLCASHHLNGRGCRKCTWENDIRQRNKYHQIILEKDGIIIRGKNTLDITNKINCQRSNISDLIKGKLKTVKGYKLISFLINDKYTGKYRNK